MAKGRRQIVDQQGLGGNPKLAALSGQKPCVYHKTDSRQVSLELSIFLQKSFLAAP
jgi:hypothetical protein